MIYIEEKILSLLSEKEFSDELIALDSDEQVKQHFAKYGVDISDEDMEKIRDIIQKTVLRVDELENSELENVNGGVVLSTIVFPVVAVMLMGSATAVNAGITSGNRDKKIRQMLRKNKEEIDALNAQGDRDVHRIESIERMAGYVLATVVVVSAMEYFRNNVKKWWNS